MIKSSVRAGLWAPVGGVTVGAQQQRYVVVQARIPDLEDDL
jgi:hypothetical protein